jgi:glycosyltransferase involved in cell wall biosynthesis
MLRRSLERCESGGPNLGGSTGTRVLYVSYDGLLDQLGGSQILPYVAGFARNHTLVIALTFEKGERLAGQDRDKLNQTLAALGIIWKPVRFTRRAGVLGKIWDLARIHLWVGLLALRHKVHIIHARGHPATQAAMAVKGLTGAKVVFDCRGLWADERVDKGGWDLRKPVDAWQYKRYKKLEERLFARADHVIVLTNAALPEVLRIGQIPAQKVTVIPCCADFDHFSLATNEAKSVARAKLGLSEKATVIGYVGSVGRIYMLDEYVRFVRYALESGFDAYALVVTRDTSAFLAILRKELSPELHGRFLVLSATRDQVPQMFHAMDLTVSFITPSYARKAASPTKLAESFAAGVPVVCNDGVGDVREQVMEVAGGWIINPKSDEDLRACAARLDQIVICGGYHLRASAAKILSLPVATNRYTFAHHAALGIASDTQDVFKAENQPPCARPPMSAP